MTEFVVERALQVETAEGMEDGFVRISRPFETDEHWSCSVDVSLGDHNEQRTVHGVDGWQAIQHAFYIAAICVGIHPAQREGRLFFLGERLDPELNIFSNPVEGQSS